MEEQQDIPPATMGGQLVYAALVSITRNSMCYSNQYISCYIGSTGCVNGAVRLVNGRRPSEGSVQICIDGVWGHVCEYYYWFWERTLANNARVVCRQLGFSTSCKLLYTLLNTYMVIQ